MDMDNYDVIQNGTLKRYTLSDINVSNIKTAYDQYQKDNYNQFLYEGNSENFYINVQEFNMVGILETAFGQTTDQGNLSTFKIGTTAVAGTGFGALVTATGGSAMSGTITATDAFAGLTRYCIF